MSQADTGEKTIDSERQNGIYRIFYEWRRKNTGDPKSFRTRGNNARRDEPIMEAENFLSDDGDPGVVAPISGIQIA